MNALTLLLSLALVTTGCDMDKVTSVQSESAESEGGAAPGRPGAGGARSAATPTPKPKQGDWMYKNYKNPLDPPKR